MISNAEIMDKAREVQRLAMEKTLEEFAVFSDDPAFWAHVRDGFAYIPGRFEWFTERDPARYGAMIESLNYVKNGLSEGVTAKIDLVKADVQDWQGRAAEQFTENFLSPFGQIRLNQIGLTEELTTALEASQGILVESRNSIADIADKTITALNNIDTDDGPDWGMALTVVGVVAAVVGAPLSGGASVAWALVGGAATIGATALAEQPTVGGQTVAEVIEGMDQAITMLKEQMADEEDILRRALAQDVDIVHTYLTDLVPPRPYVADLRPGDLSDFRLPAAMADS